MRAIINFFKKRWVIQLIGILAIIALIWFFAPYVAINDKVYLESEIARMWAIIVVLLIWGLNNLRVEAKAKSANENMTADLKSNSKENAKEETTDTGATEEVSILSKNFDYALETLKKSKGKNVRGKNYLYELPWYVIIGPSGSGKTTALINSGLEFPLSERFGTRSVQGVGGTRNCDWWFTDQAVFLDTAGNYTTQDSHENVDKAAWFGFLDLLKKHRPRRPVNGILVTMSLSDLLKMTDVERSLHAKAIRSRINELYEQFGVRFPIYMLLSKADIVAGFNDFFADLSREERGQVWGVTFPEEEIETLNHSDFTQRFAKDFDDLLERLHSRLPMKMQNERDIVRRANIFAFPQRMALLKEPIVTFLRESFGANRYQSAPMLRGVYIISSTQEGTPIDRLMGLLATTFKLERFPTPSFAGRGKSFFLQRLLKEVIFTEAEIVGVNKKVEGRRVWLQRCAYTMATVLIAGMTVLWFNSYQENQNALSQLEQRIKHYNEGEAKYWNWKSDFAILLKQMDASYALTKVYPKKDVPWSMRFGLYQGERYQPLAETTYRKLLTHYFLPLIKLRLEQRMQATEAENMDVLFQLLRVYLMLDNPEKLQPDLIKAWVGIDWENNYQRPIELNLKRHLDNLLVQPLPKIALNQALIAQVRTILTKIPLARQLYLRIKSETANRHDYDFVLQDALGKNAMRVFTAKSGSLAQQRIPGLFTYNGFHQLFLEEIQNVSKQSLEQQWILGRSANASVKAIVRLEEQIMQYYFADFNQHWDELIDNLQIRNTASLQQTVDILEAASGIDSPLSKLLETLAIQTKLTKLPEEEAQNTESLEKGAETIQNAKMQNLLNTAKAAGIKSRFVKLPGKEVERHFANLTVLVEKSGGGTSTIEQLLVDLGELYTYMTDFANANNTDAEAAKLLAQSSIGDGNDVIARLQKQAVRLPEPVKTWIRILAKANWNIVVDGAEQQLEVSFQEDISELCETTIQGRYPFVKTSKEDLPLKDFALFFADNGVMDQFFNTYLKDFVDTSTPRWGLLPQKNQNISINKEVIEQFQIAATIKEIFFADKKPLPKIEFELTPVYLDAKVAKFWLNLEGQMLQYRHGPLRPTKLTWPGERSGSVRFGFDTLDGKSLSHSETGTWAWFKILDHIDIHQQSWDKYLLTFDISGFTARYELRANSVLNPFGFSQLKDFSCLTAKES